jgi:hypothetical protein
MSPLFPSRLQLSNNGTVFTKIFTLLGDDVLQRASSCVPASVAHLNVAEIKVGMSA